MAQRPIQKSRRQKRRRQRLFRRSQRSDHQSDYRPSKRPKREQSEWTSFCSQSEENESLSIHVDDHENRVNDDTDFLDQSTLNSDPMSISMATSAESTTFVFESVSADCSSVRERFDHSLPKSESVHSEHDNEMDHDDDCSASFDDDDANGHTLNLLDHPFEFRRALRSVNDGNIGVNPNMNVDNDDNEDEDLSLSAYFDSAECCLVRQQPVKLPFSSKLVDHVCGLYATSSREVIIGMLQSARCCPFEDGQVTIIGTAADELVDVLENVISDCSMDIIHEIADFVGDALVWLRTLGMNAVKWSVIPNAVECSRLSTHCAVKKEATEREESGQKENDSDTSYLDAFDGHFGDSSNFTFYYSGYGLDELELDEATMNSLDGPSGLVFMDLDWILAAFLMLGVLPKDTDEDGLWLSYLNHKLLSAVPGCSSLSTLMES